MTPQRDRQNPATEGQLSRANGLLENGKIKAAERLLKKIVAGDPNNIAAQAFLAGVALDRGEIDRAGTALGVALRHAPDAPDLRHMLGRLLDAQGRTLDAISAYAGAIALQSDHLPAHRSLARLLFGQKRYEEARKSADILLKLVPNDVAGLRLLADIEHACGQTETALAHLARAHQFDAKNPDILKGLADLCLEVDRLDDAVSWGRRAHELAPKKLQTALSFGLALHNAGQHAEAIQILGKSLRLAKVALPQVAFAENLLARSLTYLGRRNEAVSHAARAIQIAPDDAVFASTYARALKDAGRIDDAVKFASALHRRLPDDPAIALVLGYALRESGEDSRAEDIYRRIVASPARRPEAEMGLAYVLLRQGRYQDGFAHYQARLEPPEAVIKPRPPFPMWDGTADPGIHLIVMREQGLGDEFQFCRFLAAARARVGKLTYVTHGHMNRVLKSVLGDIETSTEIRGRKNDGVNRQWVPLMSLPVVLGVSGSGYQVDGSYLEAEPEAVEKMAAQMTMGRIKVGVAWQGNPASQVEAGRSYRLEQLADVAALDGVQLYSLQKNYGLEQLKSVPFRDRITDFGEAFDAGTHAFIDTAGAMMNLDLIITSDTSIAHLAGTLGRPCWVLLQARAEWRWGHGGDTSIWYPSLRLFRQTKPGDWGSAIRPMAEAVRELVAARDVGVGLANLSTTQR